LQRCAVRATHWKSLLAWACSCADDSLSSSPSRRCFATPLTAHARRRLTSLPADAGAYVALVLLQGGSSFMETWFLQLAGQRHDARAAHRESSTTCSTGAPRSSIASRSAADDAYDQRHREPHEMFAQGAITLVADLVKMLRDHVVMLVIDCS